MKIGFLITARMKSTRLPKKVVLKIDEKEIITLLIERFKLSKIIDEIVIATSTNPKDDILCKIAEREHVKYFRGSEDDVLKRLYGASKRFSIDYIINITADCPLAAYDLVDNVVALYKETNADLITISELPCGSFIYGIKPEALNKVIEIKNDSDTEVWGTYFTDTGLFKVVDLKIPKELQRKNYRLTLDYQEDFVFLNAVFNGLGNDAHKKSSKEIIKFLDEHPEIVKINSCCTKKYQDNWEKQNRLEVKSDVVLNELIHRANMGDKLAADKLMLQMYH